MCYVHVLQTIFFFLFGFTYIDLVKVRPRVLSSESALKAEHFDSELSLGADGKYFSEFYICTF